MQNSWQHVRDELRRERLVRARLESLAEDALIAIGQSDLDKVRYGLARIVGRRLDEDDG